MASNKSTNKKSIVLSSEYEISSPESNDSGIHSEDRLNRLSNGATAQNSVKTSAESSLYSSVISSKKSSDRLSREASAYSRLDEFGELLQMQQQQQQKQLQQEEIQVYRNQIDVKQLEEDQHVVEYEEINSGDNFLHLEQHELPLGWVRCCDEEGIYYWHKPSGTVTRHPPAIPVKPTATTTSTTRTTNSSSNSNISSSTSSSKGTTPSPSPLSSSECSSSSSSSSAPTTTVLNAVQHPAPTSKSPPAKNFNVNNEYESILETTTLAMATSTDDDDNDEAKTFTFSEYVRPKSKTTTATTTAVTNQTATSASEDRSMIGGGGPDSTSLSTFSNLSSSALSNSFDQPAKAQPSALLPLPLSHFSRPSNPSTDTDLDQDNFQDNEDKKPSMYGNRKDRPSKHINIQTRYGSDFTSVSPLSTSSSNSTSSSSSNCLSALDNTKSSRHNNRSQIKQDDKSHHHQVESVVLTRRDGEASVANSSKPSLPIRFYVRSLGWVTISEADLTPERSSRAVNKCINDLSRGTKDLNDVVARWGDGKDLYMDLDDSNLVLIDPIDDNVLNTQPITSIRVWGVGRDNARDFAYVARDKQTKIHMCHVFRCDSAPAKEIANTLKETCRRVIAAEKSRSSFGGVATTTVVDSAAPTTTTTTATNSQTSLNNRLANMMLKRPSYLPDIAVNTSKVDINLKLRSVSFNSREEVEERLSAMAMATSTTASIIEENNVGGAMLTPMDEPCKRHPCKYLGSLPVNKPYGMDVLNEAVDKIYNRALDEYRKMRREKRMKSRRGRRKKAGLYRHNDSGKNDKQGYDDDDMDDDMDDYDYDEDEDDDEDDECDEMNTVSFDSMFELNSERKLGCDVDVCVSPSTITVRRRASNSHDIVDDDEVLFETRIRFLSFMGISNDVRLCGFIVHCVDNSFRCYAFMCENSCGPLCKTIEAACKLRYQKCIDAHPEAAGVVSNRNGAQNESRLNSRFGNFGIQISKTVFDSITKTRSIFSNLNLANISNNNNNNSSNGKSTKM